jgi:hypothetical protein
MIAVLAAYLLAWTTAYMVVMYNAVRRLDFSEYIHWFVLAWTFVGLEMVALTWFLSMVIFVPLAVVSVFLVRRWSKREIPAS